MLAHAGAADESLAIAMVFGALWVGWVGWSRIRGTGFGRLPGAAGPGLLGLAVVLLVASAVVPRAVFGPTPATPVPSGSATDGPRIASTATLAFERPAADQVIEGDEVQVVLDLQGGTVVEQTSSDVRPDEGHIHLSLDGALVSMTYGTVQVVDLRGIEPGIHVLDAEFVAADHLPFDPPVTASATFSMEGP
jgi:hypothetical protein